MKSLRLFFMTIILVLFSSNGFAQYQNRWCEDVGEILESYADTAYYEQTYSEELNLLKEGINLALIDVLPKWHYYFGHTLSAYEDFLELLENDKEKVLYLREVIQYALEDLRYLDEYDWWSRNCSNCAPRDNASYVQKLLKRAQRWAYSSKSDAIEKRLIKRFSQTAIRVIRESPYNRRQYECIVFQLMDLLSMDNIRLLRSSLESVIRNLSDSRSCMRGY